MAEEKTSQFWKYKIFNSIFSRKNRFDSSKFRVNKYSQTGWCGPFYFEESVNEKQFRKWIREHLHNTSEHIACKISNSEIDNLFCKNSAEKIKAEEKKREEAKRKPIGPSPKVLIRKSEDILLCLFPSLAKNPVDSVRI